MIARWDRNQWLTTPLKEQLILSCLNGEDGAKESSSKAKLVHFNCQRGADQRHNLVQTDNKIYCTNHFFPTDNLLVVLIDG